MEKPRIPELERQMEYVNLGRSGLKVSRLSWGNWVTGHSASAQEMISQTIRACLEYKINYFDTAEVYGFGEAETLMGNAFKDSAEYFDREEVVISTKFLKSQKDTINKKGLSRKHLCQSIKNSLKRLNLDTVDVIFMHRPPTATPIEEMCRAADHLIDRGYCYYWATSEFEPHQIVEVHRVCDKLGLIHPIAEQCIYNMFRRHRLEKDYVDIFNEYGMGTTIWSPLASGILSGKYNNGEKPAGSRFAENEDLQAIWKQYFSEEKKEETLTALRGIEQIAQSLQISQAQLSIAWCLKNQDASTVLLGSSRVEQLYENMKAWDYVNKLTPEIMDQIEGLLKTRPEAGFDWMEWKPKPNRFKW